MINLIAPLIIGTVVNNEDETFPGSVLEKRKAVSCILGNYLKIALINIQLASGMFLLTRRMF